MKHTIFTTIISFVTVCSNCHADSLDASERALAIISKTAASLCSQPSTTGSLTSLELSAGAKIELTRLIKMLVDIGVSGAITYQQTKYSGLLQQDLVTALRDANNCRLLVFQGLKDRLLDQAIPSEASTAASERSTSGNAMYGNTRCESYADENGAWSTCKKGIR